MSDSEVEILEEKLGSLLREGARVYVKHENYFNLGNQRFLDAEWQGLWHLACIYKGWDEASQSFTLLWARNGITEIHPMEYSKGLDIKPFIPNKKTMLNIEDDGPTSNIHTAYFVSFPDDKSKIEIRWENRKVEQIDISRVCLDASRRKRKATSFYLDESAVKKPMLARKRPDEVIELDDSSDDEEENAPVTKNVTQDKRQSSFESSSEKSFLDDSSVDNESSGDEFSDNMRDNTSEDGCLAAEPAQPQSCRGSLRKKRKKYHEQSESSGNDSLMSNRAERILSMELVSSDDESPAVDGVTVANNSAGKNGKTLTRDDNNWKTKKLISNKEIVMCGYSVTNQQHLGRDFGRYLVGLAKRLEAYTNVDTEEYQDLVIEMNSLLQEKLYHIKDKTTVLVKEKTLAGRSKDSTNNNDSNMAIIYNTARSFGLSNECIDRLFVDHLEEDKHNYFSINDAVSEIMKMSNGQKDESYVIAPSSSDSIAALTNHVGARIKKVFEDGKEYEGTIASAHFRVHYDDGDTEIFNPAEVYENLADNEYYNSCEGLMIELFSGCSLLSTLCKRKGMKVFSVDSDNESNATIKNDFMGKQVQSMLSNLTAAYIHASPVCSTYSLMSRNRHRDKNNYNKSAKSHEADKTLLQLYHNCEHQLKKNPDCIITIENPRGRMSEGNIMKLLFEGRLGFRKYEIKYCQFGRDEMKPTCIFTNDAKLGQLLVAIGGKCKCGKGNHKSNVQDDGNEFNFAALPLELCKVISSYVHSKVTQLNFEKMIAANQADETEPEMTEASESSESDNSSDGE